uniref:Uncharacterized protein n=1 Tax=Arundo donax TaxID=35708 RepID=A0A0A9F3Y5_ARUDO
MPSWMASGPRKKRWTSATSSSEASPRMIVSVPYCRKHWD